MNAEGFAPGGEMHVLEHLDELRTRLLYCLAAAAAGAAASYAFSGIVFQALTIPFYEAFPRESLIGTGPAEAFVLKLKIAFFCGLLISMPVILFQAWSFVAPGLYPSETRMAVPFVISGTALFCMGALFCYFIVFPYAFSFFHAQYLSISVTPQIRLTEHLLFVLMTTLAFGIVFEIPILAFLLARAGILRHTALIHYSRHAVVVIFLIAAILTPPDVITQLLMAGPLLLLYGISIVVAKFGYRSRTEE